MKNATKYQKKIKKFLSGIKPTSPPQAADSDVIRMLVHAVLSADAPKTAAKAMDAIEKEFVDLNELRVAPVKDVVDTLGRDFPDSRRKAEEISTVLNAIFTQRNNMQLEYVEKMTKRELRRHLDELGLRPYAAGVLMLQVFGGHAIPVDRSLVDCLEADEFIESESSIEDVQGFLERTILQKQAWAAHEFFRQYVIKNARMLARKRKAETAKAEAKAAAVTAKVEAEAAAEIQADRSALSAAKAKASKPKKETKAKTAREAAKPAKTRKKAASKSSTKAATPPKAKPTAKKTAKKAAKTAKKTAKAVTKTTKKTAKTKKTTKAAGKTKKK